MANRTLVWFEGLAVVGITLVTLLLFVFPSRNPTLCEVVAAVIETS